MKKFTLFFAALLMGFFSFAQTIPNAGFETWINNNETNTTYQVPQHWITSDVFDTEINKLFGDSTYVVHAVSQVGSAHGGQYAVQMAVVVSNQGDTESGAIYSLDSAVVFAMSAFGSGKMCGFPCATRPANLTGYFKFNRVGGDTAGILMMMTKWNTTTQRRDTLNNITYDITSNASGWTMFSVPITYAYGENPDTVLIGAGIANSHQHIGTLFTVDDFAFTGNVAIGINEQQKNAATVTVFPNPFNDEATLNITNIQLKKATLEIYDVLGNRVRVMENISGNNIIINREGLNDGIYFYHLINDNAIVATGKMSIQ